MSDPGDTPAAPVPPYDAPVPPARPVYGGPPPGAAPGEPAGAPWGAAPARPGGAPQHPAAPAYAPRYPTAPAYAPPYAQPGPHVAVPAPRSPGGPVRTTSTLGLVALVAGILAAVGASVVASLAAWRIGVGAGHEVTLIARAEDFTWAVLTPVRDWVLLGEVSFWVGTALGVWALVQGIIAIFKDRGRGFGIAAAVLAGIGPVLFFVGVQVFLTAGLAAGTSVGG